MKEAAAVCAVMLLCAWAGAAPAAELASRIDRQVRAALVGLPRVPEAASVVAYRALAEPATWTEIWPDGRGGEQQRTVTAPVWNRAVEACLAAHGAVYLPQLETPYYLNEPIVLRSGQALRADRGAEIRLCPGVNTCLVRNLNLRDGRERPLEPGASPDTDISVEGGIWTTLATSRGQNNGNTRGRCDSRDSLPGCHGVILLHNVRRVRVRNLVVREAMAFGVHLGNVREFLVENVRFERQGRDGVHVNGPASDGIIRNIRGVTYDDLIALNAWEWANYTPSFGPIARVLVERVRGAQDGAGAADSIRLLPGVKHFRSGGVVECPISDCVLSEISDIREFKLYDQPNLELGRDNDFSDPIGTLRNLHFEGLSFARPGSIRIGATAEGVTIRGVRFAYDVEAASKAGYRLVEIGPLSMTWKMREDDPASWVEVFSPDRDVVVRGLELSGVESGPDGAVTAVTDPLARLVAVRDQQLNPDYPRTVPRGGTGKARLVP